jgi:cytochrome c
MQTVRVSAAAMLAAVLTMGLAGCGEQAAEPKKESAAAPAKPAAPAPTAPETAPLPPASAPAPAAVPPGAPAAGAVEIDVVDASGAKMSGDPVRGATVFKQCAVCHTLEAGVNKVGPTLHGIIGRTAGSVEGFNYSKANKESGIVWTEQQMFEYLENPRATVPGTKMAFAGLKKPQDRADVIAYIQEQSN